jgi:hypothetical protein
MRTRTRRPRLRVVGEIIPPPRPATIDDLLPEVDSVPVGSTFTLPGIGWAELVARGDGFGLRITYSGERPEGAWKPRVIG